MICNHKVNLEVYKLFAAYDYIIYSKGCNIEGYTYKSTVIDL